LEQQARDAALAYQRLQSEWPWMGVATYWFLKQADDRERDQNPQYFFRLLEPDFTPMPAYTALSQAAHMPPVMYPGFHQEDHWALQYDEGWRTVRDTAAVLGGYRQATRDGATVRFTFRGTDLWLLGFPSGGRFEVVIDDGVPVTIDPGRHATALAEGTRIALAHDLPDDQHRVRLTARAESGSTPAIDGFIIASRQVPGLQRGVGAAAMLGGLLSLVWLARSRCAPRPDCPGQW
jgi:hypothetical protein